MKKTVAPPFGEFADVQIADMNNDRTLDIVALVTNGANTTVMVYIVGGLPAGPVTFTNPAGMPLSGYPVAGTGAGTSCCVGLFNNDSFYDVAVTVRGGSGDRVEFLQGILDGGGNAGARLRN